MVPPSACGSEGHTFSTQGESSRKGDQGIVLAVKLVSAIMSHNHKNRLMGDDVQVRDGGGSSQDLASYTCASKWNCLPLTTPFLIVEMKTPVISMLNSKFC
jgi:hypothetical protein